MNAKFSSRRKFIKSTAAIVAVPYVLPSSVLGKEGAVAPSEKITVGCIGMGGHGIGRNLKMYLGQADAQVVAVCDVDGGRLKHAEKMVNDKYGGKGCGSCKDFRKIIERKDIDAVMISTPDHWHTLMSVMAAKAG